LLSSNDPPTTDLHTLSLHDALPILQPVAGTNPIAARLPYCACRAIAGIGEDIGPLRAGVRREVEHEDDRDLGLDRLRARPRGERSEEHTSELQSRSDLVCRLLLEKK